MNLSNLDIAHASVELVGAIVCAMLAAIIIINSNREQSIRRIEQMLFIAAGILASDAAFYIANGKTALWAILLNRIGNLMGFLLNLLLAYCSISFIYAILEERKAAAKNLCRKIVIVSSLIALGIILVNFFTGWMYYFDDENDYHRNWAWYVYTGLSLVSMATSCVLVVRQRKGLGRAQTAALLLFLLCPLAATVLQSFFYGLALTNMGIGISVVVLLVAYLITWNQNGTRDYTPQLRRSLDTILLFVIMAVCMSVSIVSCIASMRSIAGEISRSNSQTIAHIISDGIGRLFNGPVTVTQTMANDFNLQNAMAQNDPSDPEANASEMASYLESIRNGFGYQIVYVVCDESKAFYTDEGFKKQLNAQQDNWYSLALNFPRNYMLFLDTEASSNWGLSLFINANVYDGDGRFLGVCGAALEIQTIQSVLAEYEEHYNVEISLLDENGRYRFGSREASREEFTLPDYLQDVKDDFQAEYLANSTRLSKYLPEFGLYLTIEDLMPEKVNLSYILVPNILIFMIGLFTLLVAFCVILIRERKIAGELIEKRRFSLVDELTGLRNRRAMREDFRDWSSSAGALCVVLMDLNGLKEINDTLGHQAGDTLIVGAAQCFADTLGHYGTVYRTGGDEFVAMLHCPKEALPGVLSEFEERAASWSNQQISGISVSKGIALSEDQPDMNINELIDLADQRMYADKREYYKKTGKRHRH